MKLLWIDLNSSYAHASLALPALHAQVMRHADIEWDVVSATANEPLGPVVEDIVRRRPDVLAATAWLFTHEALLHLLARVRALLPECVVILGGPEFLDDNEDYLRRIPWVDAVFRGEGEEMFPQWLPVWAQREQWREIPGLCYIDPLSHTYQDNDTARVTHFDRLVPPEESEVQLEEPRLLRHGQNFGIRLNANAPSYHIVRVDLSSAVEPIVGTHEQGEAFVAELLEDYRTDAQKLWETEFFGKTLRALVDDGLKKKSEGMPENIRKKITRTISRVVNDGKGGFVCILL